VLDDHSLFALRADPGEVAEVGVDQFLHEADALGPRKLAILALGTEHIVLRLTRLECLA